ncbi:hypothetical protein DES53_10453 [Roseimicrobium gellanilyticum]|uniref:Uncharacterized protein n=1 Tax=Roseimicrobium gellanilyticum TaxID=748857 RepID=A0A366HPX2_9BACT|nr:hypothetical protein [Roseimicrobium gellanilyticum]RBP44234.1 hypothetical protein DES53_10453 [Roseimicrobium gellanilyticum]
MRLRLHHFIGILLALLGLLLFTAPLATSKWEPLVKPLVYESSGQLRADGISRKTGIFLYEKLYDHHLMWPLGVAVLVLGLGLALRGLIPWSKKPLTRVAQILGAIVTCASVFFTMPVFLVEPESEMRLVGWGALVLALTLVGLLFAFAAGVPALMRDTPRAPALVGLLLCLAPLPVSLLLMSLAHAVLGFRLAV